METRDNKILFNLAIIFCEWQSAVYQHQLWLFILLKSSFVSSDFAIIIHCGHCSFAMFLHTINIWWFKERTWRYSEETGLTSCTIVSVKPRIYVGWILKIGDNLVNIYEEVSNN